MARRVTSPTGLPGDTGQYVAASTVAWPADEPPRPVTWRRFLTLGAKRPDAELLPPLFGTAKSGARYDRGTWQYWVVRLPLASGAPGLIFGHALRHHLVWLAIACLAGGFDVALGEKRQPVSWAWQCAAGARTVVLYAALMLGCEQLLFGNRVLGACLAGAALAYGFGRGLVHRLAVRADRDNASNSAPIWELSS